MCFIYLPVRVSLLLDAVTFGMLRRLVSCPSDCSILIETALGGVALGVAILTLPLFIDEDVFAGGTILGGPLSLILPKSCVGSSSKI